MVLRLGVVRAMVGVVVLGTVLAACGSDEDLEVINPAWHLRAGQVLSFDRPEGEVRVGIWAVYPPDKEYDYLRVAAVIMGPDGRPADPGIRAPTPGQDSYVPVGKAAQSTSLGEAADQIQDALGAQHSMITPGYLLLVPDDSPTDTEPSDAGFHLEPGLTHIPTMDGYAQLLTWSDLAAKLE